MVLRNLPLKRNRAIIILFLALSAASACSQTTIPDADSVWTRLLDADLNPKTVSYSKLLSKPTVIISNVNCIACTEYFTKAKKNFHFIFILSQESLAEINRILAYHHLKKEEAYFTTCQYIPNFKSTLCAGPTPCLAYKREGRFLLLNYTELSQLTAEFSVKMASLKKRLR